MDLIYMDANRVELGVLKHYTLDLDIANDKDYEIKVLDDEAVLQGGYWWYIDGTEYGGRVDKIEHDTNGKTVTYTGRNWRGLLNSKIIEPAPGSAYAYAEGLLSDALGVLITELDFADLFSIDEENTTAEITQFQFDRYCTLYDGIIAILENNNCKLRLRYNSELGKCVISAGLITDHSDYLTYVSENSLNYKVSQRKCGVNHLVCLGRGDGDARAVIHLFCDDNGAVQSYTLVSNPLSNADYILDKSNQVLTGLDERAQVYDYPNAEITYNYVMLTSTPFDWAERYFDYYEIDSKQADEELSSARYKAVEAVIEETYTLLTAQPGDWESNFAKYYYLDGGEYKPVAEYGVEAYERLYTQPADWATNYGNYYYYHFDGVKYEYLSVGSATNVKYTLQTQAPSDWATNYKNYYCLKEPVGKTVTKYVKVTGSKAPTWKKSTFYRKSGTKYILTTSKPSDWSTNYKNYYVKEYITEVYAVSAGYTEYTSVSATASGKAPTWKKSTYYTKYSDSVAPPFRTVINGGEYYCRKNVTATAPEFKTDTFYSYEKREVAPPFSVGLYYEKKEDWYKVLAESGVTKLAELNAADQQTVTLAELEAEIGDVVSGYDLITQSDITEPVTNIIVKIKNNVLSLDYTVGGKK